jgi:hypothetical protein
LHTNATESGPPQCWKHHGEPDHSNLSGKVIMAEREIITIPSDDVYALAERLQAQGSAKMSQGSDMQIAAQIIKSMLADGSIGAGIAIRTGEGN